jgi:hypothetical protein
MKTFLRHYLEMVAAMFIGMGILGTPLLLAVSDDAHALKLAIMGVTMTAPMVAWMRYRGHGWAPSNEMAAAMLIPTAGVIALQMGGTVEDYGTLMALEHAVMLPAMLVAMLLRRGEYTSDHHSEVAV